MLNKSWSIGLSFYTVSEGKSLCLLLSLYCLFPKSILLSLVIQASCHGGGLPSWLSGKKSASQFKRRRKCRYNPWIGKIFWRRKWQHTWVFLSEKSHGQRRHAGYSPCGHKEQNMTEQLSTSVSIVEWSYIPMRCFSSSHFIFVQTSYSSFSDCGHRFYCPTLGCIIGLSGIAASSLGVVYPCLHPS